MDEPVIKKELYFFYLDAGIPYEGWVDFGDGKIAWALKEVEIVKVPYNKYKHCFYVTIETSVCDIGSIGAGMKLSSENYSYLNSLVKEGKFLGTRNGVLQEMDNTFLSTKRMRVIRGSEKEIFLKNVNGLRWIKGVGLFLGAISTWYSGYQFYKNPNWENGINFGIGLGSLAYWEIGVMYMYINISMDYWRREQMENALETEKKGLSGDWQTIMINSQRYGNPTGPCP